MRCRDYALPGCYRKCVVRPSGLHWEVIRYNDYQVSLVTSDYDKLTALTNPSALTDPSAPTSLSALADPSAPADPSASGSVDLL